MDSASENEEMSGATFLDAQYLHEENDCDDSQDGDEYERSTGTLREQDRFLPIANVARLMKKAIPKTGKIAKDARECVQESVSEFVSFITSEASERCHTEKRKTINGEDILFAMSSLGFDNYVEPLKIYLQKYRESMKGEKNLDGSQGGTSLLSDEFASDGGEHSNDTPTSGPNLIYFESNDVKPPPPSNDEIF